MTRPAIKLAPSILSADFARLGEAVALATRGGADYIHVDVMDGHFVPNITFGPSVVAAIRPYTHLPLDVHLMVSHPEQFVTDFARAGANILTIHVEAVTHLHRVVSQIREAGMRPGVVLNPATPVSAAEDVLPYVDMVLLMTVNPGFPGQAFIQGMEEKVARMRRLLDERGLSTELEVDGGVKAHNASMLAKAGATVLVAGSAVFDAPDGIEAAIGQLRASVGEL